MRTAFLVIMVAAMLAATGCAGDSSADPSLLFGDAEGLIEQPADGSEPATLIAVPSRTDTFRDPAISLDGERIAYVHAPPYIRGEGYIDAHSDLWIANRNGSDAELISEHSRPTELLSSPHWLDDETILVQSTYRSDPGTAGGANVRALTRFDTTTGERVDLIKNVIEFAVTPDGVRVAFTAIDSIEEQPIYIAEIDGSDRRLLVGYGTGLGGFLGLEFSSDGSRLYFGAHTETQARLATSRRGGSGIAGGSWSATHDAPVDLWSVDAAGGEPSQVAELEATAPSFTRSASPDVMYVLAGWLASIDISTGEVFRITDPDVNGSLTFVDE